MTQFVDFLFPWGTIFCVKVRRNLAWVMLGMSAANALRGALAWQLDSLLETHLSVSPMAIGAWYLAWGAGWAVLGLAVLRGRALRAVVPVAWLYQLAAWLLRWFYDRSEYARALWGRDALLTLLFLALFTWWGVRAVSSYRGEVPIGD